ncbi:FAD-dependent monooxygenase [Mycobacterium sp.]|uniref:FAD-dependent monooxygenase n=1 Tax=Mycobacterium sp. TaxID=1785 RepID=UPI003BAC7B31
MAQRILVVGAGIAGLATAGALQQADHDVTVVEERTDTSTGSAISVWPNALAALDHLGLGEAVREAGQQVNAATLRWHDGGWLRHLPAERLVAALGEPLIVIQRSVLRDILMAGVLPGSIEYGRAAEGLLATGGGVHIAISDGTARRADALIGADGVGSMVAHHLNGPLARRYAGYTAWRGIARCGMDPMLAGATLGPGVEMGHVPLAGDRTYWYATERVPEGRLSPGGELAYLRAKLARWADPVPNILAATAPTEVSRNDLYDRACARSWAHGAVALVGDAAHPMRPHLGQGGCQGIEDAAVLGAFVQRAADLPTAFARFAAFRRARVRSLIRESAMVGRVINLRPKFLSTASCRAIAALPEALFTRHLAAVAARSAFHLA